MTRLPKANSNVLEVLDLIYSFAPARDGFKQAPVVRFVSKICLRLPVG
jgi:hypothetical protein